MTDLISWKEMIYEVGVLSNRILTNIDDSLFIEGMLESGLVKREWSGEKKNEVIEVKKTFQ